MIVAETEEQAREAADLVEIDFDEHPVTVGLRESAAPEAQKVWPERDDNIAFFWTSSHEEDADDAMAKADRVIELDLVNNRLVTNYMKVRSAIGEYDADADRYTLTTGSQGVHLLINVLAGQIFNLDPDRFRIVTPDVGGGFGTRYFAYREYALGLHAARMLGRPVAWVADRSDHFLGDYHGRDQVSSLKLGVDARGKFLALKVDTLANMGAYLSQLSTFVPSLGGGLVSGTTGFPPSSAAFAVSSPNTIPVDAYRGAGRPEAAT